MMSMIISRWEISPTTTAIGTRTWGGMGEVWARYGRDMGRCATTIGARTAVRLARLAPPPPPTLSAPRPTAMPTMAAQATFFTC